MLTVISYDIRDDKRRLKIASLLLDHGDRIQFSVFVTRLTGAKLRDLISEVRALLDAGDDLRSWQLCAQDLRIAMLDGDAELTAGYTARIL